MIPTLFFIFLGVAALGVIAAVVNMVCIAKKFTSGSIFDHRASGFSGNVIAHFVCGFFYVVGSIGAFITGIMWIVTYCKAV